MLWVLRVTEGERENLLDTHGGLTYSHVAAARPTFSRFEETGELVSKRHTQQATTSLVNVECASRSACFPDVPATSGSRTEE